MSYSDEFPLLEGVGLYASNISGDGNCLFHALSDQLYGHENNHAEIRARVVNHMRGNADCFKLFLDVGPSRRAPKRKAASGSNAAVAATAPSESAIDGAFEKHLVRMSRAGVYGDNMEISAFAREYECDVKIYQRDFAYVVTGGEEKGRKICHIAYHTWEHYSSVRNRDGPHVGPPNVCPIALTEEGRKEQEKRMADSSCVLPWMEGVVALSLPYLADATKIREALEEAKGNVDAAVSKLLDADEEKEKEKEDNRQDGRSDGKEKKDEDEDERDNDAVVPKPLDAEEGEGEEDVHHTDGAKKTKKPTARKGTRASARIRARDGSRSSIGSGSGPETSASAADEPRKQQPLRPKRETAREKKAKQKAAAKERKKEKALGNKGTETSEKDTSAITTGIKELYV